MTAPSTVIDLQTGLFHSTSTAHEQAGFELGWDYAHHRLAPPAPYASEPSPLASGLAAGRAAFGARTLPAGRHVRRWLALRLRAWLRGRSVEPVQVTPNYLQQIDATHCPITRMALIDPLDGEVAAPSGAAGADDAVALSIDRVLDDAGYAAGNLAVMSRRANHAKGTHGRDTALAVARALDAAPAGTEHDGLDAAAWRRIATLCSFVEPMAHADACRWPMRVLPPNRLRLFNPVQALQAFVGRQFLKPGWSERIAGFVERLPNHALRRDFHAFFIALLPRVIEAGGAGDAARARWAVEDAWGVARVQAAWERFALQLDPAQCEALLIRAAAARLAVGAVMPLGERGATDGWALATRGYVPHAPAALRSDDAAAVTDGRGEVDGAARPEHRQRQLAW